MNTERLAYLFFRLVSVGIQSVSLEVAIRMGRFMGGLGWLFAGPYRRLVRRNLDVAFGGEKSSGEKERIGREHFKRLVGNIFASVNLSSWEPEELFKRVSVEGGEHLDRLNSEKRGMVFALSHLGNWELMGKLSRILVKGASGAVYQSLSNPYIDAWVRRDRAKYGMRLFARKKGFFAAMEMLRQGGSVGVLCDQHAGDSGVWVPFFGRLASSSPLPATMAKRTGAVILPVTLYTDGVGRWRLVVRPPFEESGREVEEITAELNRVVEEQIRASPEDWLWAHNRWKTPKPRFLLGKTGRPVKWTGFSKKFKVVVRSVNWLGDAVMTVPAVKSMKKSRPDVELTVLTQAKIAGFWREVPEVDRVVEIPAGTGIRGVAALIREGGYDVAVVLPNSLRTGVEAWWAGVPRRVGYRGHWRSWFLNQILSERGLGKKGREHQVHHYLRLAEYIGALRLPEEEWTLPPKSTREKGMRWRLAVCPGAEYGPAKRWFPERYAEVMSRVSEALDCEWNIVGVPKDAEFGKEIERGFRGEHLSNWIGQTSLVQLVGMLKQCDLLLTNDTGTMHLAAMLGTPVVAIFGSTEPVLTGPLGQGHSVIQHRVPCGPCFQRECHLDFACMKNVEVEEVADAVLAKIAALGR